MAASVLMFGLASIRVACIDGLLRRVTIDGPSMAPSFCGAHYKIQCDDCSFEFACDAEHVPADRRAACPNCGFTDNKLDAARLLPPQRVLIDRWPLVWRAIRRGDVVALREPGGELAIKRIAGLPGEQMAVQNGDLFSGKAQIRKSATELHAVQLLVHDNAYQPRKSTSLPNRWRGAGASSRWQKTATGFEIDASNSENGPYDWLEYVHWPCAADNRTRGVPSPVLDNDSYNQGDTKRSLNVVGDVSLSCRLQTIGEGLFLLAALDGEQRFEVEFVPKKQVLLRLGGELTTEKPLRTDFTRRAVEVEFGLCDQQFLLALDGRTIIRHEYTRPAPARAEPLHPLSIGAASIGLQITNLRVWRDIHYLDPSGLPRRWQASAPLGPDQYAVLGDNQPVSIDSRHWEPPDISRRHILGHVYLPFWTAK